MWLAYLKVKYCELVAKDIKAMDICNMYISLYILQEVNIDAHIDKAADRHFYFIKPSPKQNKK